MVVVVVSTDDVLVVCSFIFVYQLLFINVVKYINEDRPVKLKNKLKRNSQFECRYGKEKWGLVLAGDII